MQELNIHEAQNIERLRIISLNQKPDLVCEYSKVNAYNENNDYYYYSFYKGYTR